MIVPTLLTGVAILLVKFASAEYEVDKYCQVIPAGTKLPSLENCQVYYSCLPNQKAFKSICPGDTVFDKDAQSCIPQSGSNCYFGRANPCANKHLEFAYCSNGCNWFNWCVNGQIAGNGTCQSGQKFNVASGNCTFGTCESSDRNGVQDMCNIMPEGAYFGDFENCAAWHQCENSIKESGFCQNDLVFDAVSGGCLKNEGKMCDRAKNGINNVPSGPPDWPCYDESQVVADTNICSRYYTCKVYGYVPEIKYQWVAMSCKNRYFDVISKTCSSTFAAKTFPTCDRCELIRGNNPTYFVNAAEPSCNKYVTCKNGKRTGDDIKSCPLWEYFNEIYQACDGSEERWGNYEASGGVCQDYDCTLSRDCYEVSKPPVLTS